ncbi:MAG: PD40 domain-containing protein [Acidobacteria bacterium]|nr:PD40 domain-containing protein [Acidobacteriota bacterium]
MALTLFAGSSTAQTATPPPQKLSIEDVLRWRMASHPAISPDARRVAYIVTENNFESSRPVSHLWVVDVETKQTRRLTQTDEGAAEPLWSPDGHWIAFLSARGNSSVAGRAIGTAAHPAQVWLLPLDGGESFPLTAAADGVLHYRWAPDSKSILFVAQETVPSAAMGLRQQKETEKRDAMSWTPKSGVTKSGAPQ